LFIACRREGPPGLIVATPFSDGTAQEPRPNTVVATDVPSHAGGGSKIHRIAELRMRHRRGISREVFADSDYPLPPMIGAATVTKARKSTGASAPVEKRTDTILGGDGARLFRREGFIEMFFRKPKPADKLNHQQIIERFRSHLRDEIDLAMDGRIDRAVLRDIERELREQSQLLAMQRTMS
jgi:hypothetical protein